jgi:hypothetical protein
MGGIIMPSLRPKTIYIGSEGAANVYVANNSSSSNYTIIKNINITNRSTANKTLSLHVLPPGQALGNSNFYLCNVTMLANETISIDTTLILSNGHAIRPVHDGNIAMIISGVEYF